MSPARCLAVLALLAMISPAAAHEESQSTVRELVRIQGYRGAPPGGLRAERPLTLTVLGEPLPFAATEWRSFAFRDPKAASPPAEPPAYALQGDRPLLRRITTARPEQQLTILAERRAGRADLFVLAVDRCPPE